MKKWNAPGRARVIVAAAAVGVFASLGGVGYAAGLVHLAHSSATDGQYPPSKVTICHHTHSQKNPFVTITVSVHALPAHLGHGDTIGACSQGATGATGPTGAKGKLSAKPIVAAHVGHDARGKNGHAFGKGRAHETVHANQGHHSTHGSQAGRSGTHGKGHGKGHDPNHGQGHGQGHDPNHGQGHGPGGGHGNGHKP
jgi:hypothetical protein